MSHSFDDPLAESVRTGLLDLLARRAAPGTICPSEAARLIGEQMRVEWRDLMRPVRQMAAVMADRGAIEVLQGGIPVDIREARGPVRLRLKPPFPR